MAFTILLPLAMLTGCSPSIPEATLSGNVTLNGKPYSDSAVMLIDLNSGQAGGTDIQPDGSFAIADPLPLGTYNVYLAPKALSEAEAASAAPITIDTSVPDKYWSEHSTDITVTIEEGENTATIELKS
ncbi:peptidase associated/transthyretin-like domain-containing protein [Roseimaritima ulvae]|uniref:carboxypeptidase regulatory-like domain-containing protein n=1 Tax=Roseimaritima ulvae TaxID=980254 RepID=UPI0011CD3CBE|nr:carboxypeptidase regulatory-like domain-containing protein [Roseimaritima ulvae]